jgi:hypothetical protein
MLDSPRGYAGAKRQAKKLANAKVTRKDGYILHEYPDYDTYKMVQVTGNKAKLGMQHVKESHIAVLAEHLNKSGVKVTFGLCHGTRQGREQAWFRKHLKGRVNVIGTEISDTADQFPHTVQWDFHDPNPEWEGKANLVYSNSWDHAYDPVKAFGNWIDMLKSDGVIMLDYTAGHAPRAASPLDPFGITLEALVEMLGREFGDKGEVVDVLNCTDNPDYRAQTVVFRRH